MSNDTYTEDQVEKVLNGVGIDVISQTESNFMIFCPFHNNHKTPAGTMSKEKGLFFCFGCQTSKNLTEFVMAVSNRTYFEAVRYITQKDKETDIQQMINKKLHTEPEFVQFDEVMIKRLNNQALETPKAMNYFYSRRITEESVKNFALGYSEKQNYVTIPVQSPDGMTIGFVARSIEGKDFKNTPGLPKSKILFNLHRVRSSKFVYVVESSFDAIRLSQVGFPAVATLGANVSSIQIQLLEKYFSDVILVADNDEAGAIMKDRILGKIGSKVAIVNIDKKYKDIGEMSDEEIKKLEYRFDNSIVTMLK
jgi:DNA primase